MQVNAANLWVRIMSLGEPNFVYGIENSQFTHLPYTISTAPKWYCTQALFVTNLTTGTKMEKFWWNLAADLKKSFFLGTKCLEIEIVGPGVEKRFSILGHKANQKSLDGSKFCKSWHHHSVEYQGFCNKQTNEWILSNNTSGVPSKSYFWTTHRSTS